MRAAAPWAVGATLLAVAGLLAWMVYSTSVFGVSRVQVTGTEILSPLEVQDAAAVRPGTPLARVDLDEVRRRVAALAPVERADVAREWPSTLRIAVVERTAVAAVPTGRQFLLLDANGVAFHTVDVRPPDLAEVRLGHPGSEDSTTRAALRVLASLTPQLREQLVRIDADAPARIRLELRGSRTVVWGDATENETKAQVATALVTRGGTEIDVSAPEVPTTR
jgi:cell division protein FtsQ